MKKMMVLLTGAVIVTVSAVFAGPIHEAVENQDLNRVQAIVAENPDKVNEKNLHNDTPLHLAAISGNKDIVEFLINSGADINMGDNENSPPLVNAAVRGHFEIVELMLEKGASPTLSDDNGMMPLHFAAMGGDPRIVELLLSRGAAVNAGNRNGLTPAIYAAYRGHLNALRLLLENGTDLHATTGGGTSLLHGAANSGSVEACEFLIAQGIDPNLADTTGRTPLFDAVERGRLETARLLLQKGASVNPATSMGETPLLACMHAGNPETLELLLDAGADPNARYNSGYTSLHICGVANKVELGRILLARGADPNAADEDGVTPLYLAARNSATDMCALLIDNGAKPDIKENKYGMTPLHAASLRGYLAIVDRLIAAGADLKARDNAGNTPLYYAGKYGYKKVAETIRAGGAAGEKMEGDFGPSPLLSKAMSGGEAVVWYTGHSGWAVKTQNHLLVFDYWEQYDPPDDYCLANGHINPAEIQNLPVTVFASHNHSDHYHPGVFEWRETIPKINYILGFEPDSASGYQYLGPRQEKIIDGVKITTIESNDSGVGFLVEADGVVIYHAGDHANRQRDFSGPYLAEIDFLAQKGLDIDLAFMPISGCGFGDQEAVKLGVWRTLEILSPKYVFPQHATNTEYRYREFADEAAAQNFTTKFLCAEHKGDRFIYKGGTVAF